jgi:hypothetical protein
MFSQHLILTDKYRYSFTNTCCGLDCVRYNEHIAAKTDEAYEVDSFSSLEFGSTSGDLNCLHDDETDYDCDGYDSL